MMTIKKIPANNKSSILRNPDFKQKLNLYVVLQINRKNISNLRIFIFSDIEWTVKEKPLWRNGSVQKIAIICLEVTVQLTTLSKYCYFLCCGIEKEFSPRSFTLQFLLTSKFMRFANNSA